MKKEVQIEGHLYIDASNRSPIMALVGERICSLETILKEAEVFDFIEPRTVTKTFRWGDTYETNAKVTKADIEGQFKRMKVTVIVEEF